MANPHQAYRRLQRQLGCEGYDLFNVDASRPTVERVPEGTLVATITYDRIAGTTRTERPGDLERKIET